ncbi:regulator of G-protein signaling 22 [Amblyraja radiata]|uniref:regulator of G-protein signaling 22 n=1 Tax=Amblyraja radiata TaxID=386614 RepID=UPI001402E2E1|nr:regulator of G-protein signaling 22 [Amblyraja radiata]
MWFNKVTETFEIVDNAKKDLLKQLKSMVHALEPVDPIYDVTVQSRRNSSQPEQKITNLDEKFDDKYIVMTLDPEQGMVWIKNERLPAFLLSDCYFDYRLAKLLSQVKCGPRLGMHHIDPMYRPWAMERKESQVEEMETMEIEKKNKVEDVFTDFKYWDKSPLISVQLESRMSKTITASASGSQTEVSVSEAGEEFPTISIQSGTETLPYPTGVSGSTADVEIKDKSLVDVVMEEIELEKSHITLSKVKIKSEESCTSSFSRPRIVDDTVFESVPEKYLDATEIVSFKRTPETEFLLVSEEKPQVKEKIAPRGKITGRKEQIRTDEATSKDHVSSTDVSTTQSIETNLRDETKQHLDGNAQLDPNSNVSQAAQENVENSPAVNNAKSQGLSKGLGNESTVSDSSNEEDDIKGYCYVTPHHIYNFKSRNGIERFKEFLQGTAGEKYWWLWMDIERLKMTKDGKKKQSYLNKIRSRYLFSGGEYSMNFEIRARLGLSFISEWTVEHLCTIQSDIVAPLLLYWGPRYCINQGYSIRHAGIILKDWQDRQLRPKSDIGPFPITPLDQIQIVCLPKEKCPSKNNNLHQSQRKIPIKRQSPKKSCPQNSVDTPRINQEEKEHFLPSNCDTLTQSPKSMQPFEDLVLREAKDLRNLKMLMQITKYHEALCDHKIDDLLHALHNESRTGFYFTNFCKETGNELWINGVDLWFELKEYQTLFYADIFQPFKLKRQAQFIFATYTVEGAPADVKIDIENRKSIYNKLEPPFEELFDQLEEHILILLLVPWIKMLDMDNTKYEKVELIDEVRHLDSIYINKLRELQRKVFPHKDFPTPIQSAILQTAGELKNTPIWKLVPLEFRDYTFEGLLRNRLQLEHFQEFLKDNLAGMDLKCWLDIEAYRSIYSGEKEMRNKMSKDIIKKYLNHKYFFGPTSPATKAQQEEVVVLAGGRDKLLNDQLTLVVGTELQHYAKARLERKWLPKFLASKAFAERHHKRVQMEDVVEDQMLQKSRKKRELMKHITSKWATSSKEIIAFRKALLNPVTVQQFQRFVSPKGNLMENNVVFWLEVQKYKDLFHSHASEEIIQNKISVIINCFINSNIPPAVQIDIPLEYAQRVTSRRQDQGPYIFREAQMAVFAVLFQLWPAFSEYRKRLAIDAFLPALEGQIGGKEKRRKFLMDESSTERTETSWYPSSVDTDHPHYSEMGSRSSGSQLSLKGGSGRKDDKKTKTGYDEEKLQIQTYGQKLSWSFSKYMEALDREKALILREHKVDQPQNILENTVAGNKIHLKLADHRNKLNPSQLKNIL